MANYPITFDTDATLYVAVNNKRTRLTAQITDTDLTIPVVTTSGFPTSGFITILSDPTDILKAEAIKYGSLTVSTFLATQRGAGDTTARIHNSGDNVDLTIVADHHNELKNAVIALEHMLGVSGSENFVRIDDFGNVVVTGTVEVVDAATIGSAITAFQDTPQATTNASFVDANCTTPALENDVPYIVLYCGNVGSTNDTNAGQMQLLFGSTAIAKTTMSPGTSDATALAAHNRGGQCLGFYHLVGSGGSDLKFQFRRTSGGGDTVAGAMGIVAVPMSRFQENEDYFQQTQNGDTNVVVDAGTSFTPLLQSTFSIPTTGTWLWLSSLEAANDNTNNDVEVRFLADGVVESPVWVLGGDGTAQPTSFTHVEMLHINTTGNHTFTSQIRSTSGLNADADARRGRHILIRRAAFDQIVETKDLIGQEANSTSYVTFSGLNTTYTATRPEPVVIMAQSSLIAEATSNRTGGARLRNVTNNTFHRTDSGQMTDDVNNSLPPLFMVHHEQITTGSYNYEVQFRRTSSASATIEIGRDEPGTGGLAGGSSLFVWGLSRPINSTFIDGSHITTSEITAEEIAASKALTVSGIPVITSLPTSFPFLTILGNLDVGGTTTTLSGVITNLTAVTGSITNLGVGNNLTVVGTSFLPTVNSNLIRSTTISGTAITGTTGQFGGNLSAQNLTANTLQGITITGTTGQFGETVSAQSGFFSTALTVSGTPVMHQGISGVTVSGLNLSKGQIDFRGSRAANVSIANNIITIDAPAVAAGGGGGGSGNITDINGAIGPSVTITGAGTVSTLTIGNNITISGSGESYVHLQPVGSTVWTINHPLLTTNIVAQIYDTSDVKITADAETAVDEDTYVINFNTTVSGKAVLLKGAAPGSDHGALTGLIDDDHTQYIRTDGIRAFTGSQSLGGHNLTNVGQITAVTGTYLTSLTISGVPVSTGGGGASDHGALTGLSDDDHPQYGALSQDETVTGAWNFSNSLTVSGVPVVTGTLIAVYADKDGVDQTGVVNNTTTKITFPRANYNFGNAWNTATSTFTCPRPGLYSIHAAYRFTSAATSTDELQLRLFKNGADLIISQGQHDAGTQVLGVNFSAVLVLAGEDTLEFNARHNGSAADTTIDGNVLTTWMTIALLGGP